MNTLDQLRQKIAGTYKEIAELYVPRCTESAFQRQLKDVCSHLANLCAEVEELRRAVNSGRSRSENGSIGSPPAAPDSASGIKTPVSNFPLLGLPKRSSP
jgi:hypothetical protein